MSDTHERFRAARQFEPELTPRQREILALLAAGRTNTEIAAAYEMTPDGAKWHVSEIYSKLGLASREEAAAYWHWRNGIGSKLVAFLRALVPAAIPLKVAAGSMAALATIAVVAAFLLLPHDDSFTPGDPYSVTIAADEVSEVYEIEFSFQDDTHQRHTLTREGTVVAESIYDGVSRYYSAPSDHGKYVQEPIANRSTPSPLSRAVIAYTGRLAGTAPAPTLDLLIAHLESYLDSPPGTVRVIGTERFLGRNATVLEAGPIDPDLQPSGSSRQPVTVTYRIVVDDESLIILRWTTPLPGGTTQVDSRVTKLDLSPTFPPGTFVFVPGPGAVLATPSVPANTSDATRLSIPPGFLAISKLPPGMQLLGSKANPDGEPRLFAHFGRADTSRTGTGEPFLDITQQSLPVSNPPDARPYESVSLAVGREARLFTSPNGELELQILLDHTLATLTTNELSRQQLIDWANTLQLRQ